MRPSETDDDIEPRPEARPLKWDELTPEQESAAKRACTLLGKIAKRSWGPAKDGGLLDLFLPPIDPERVNHVVLLDGERGSGKTALLITLLDALSMHVRRATGAAPHDEKRLSEAVSEKLGSPGQIVPIGLVDLQPLPPSTNLLLYIVGRFHGLVEAIEQAVGHGGARPPFHATADEEPRCRTRWREFLRAAAIGWDHGLEGRRATLDPEAYAFEVEQAERQRLDVVSSFRRFVDVLADDYQHIVRLDKRNPPLFVVSIDDADMNPGRSLELLDLVRTLWHPRVAFLATGDSSLFRETLRIHLLGTLRKPLLEIHAIVAEHHRSLDGELHDRLANAIYNKVIPPAHRCELPRLSTTTRHKRISRLFKELGVQAPSTAKWLATLFDEYEPLRAALPDRLRTLVDFEHWLRSHVHSRAADASLVAEVVAHLWMSTLGDAELSYQARLQRWVLWDSTNQSIVLNFDTAPSFNLENTRRRGISTDGSVSVIVGQGIRINATVIHEKDKASPLGDPLTGCLIAIFDLGLSRRAAVENIYTPYLFPEEKRLCTFQVYTRGRTFQLGWSLPTWSLFISYLDYARRWSTTIERIQDQPQVPIVELARSHVAAIIDSIGQPTSPASASDKSWGELAQMAGRLAVAPLTDTTDPAILAWARGEAGLLAAPEYGLPAVVANEWLQSFREAIEQDGRWEEFRTALAENRWRRLGSAASVHFDSRGDDTPIGKIVREIDMRSPEHEWSAVVEVNPQDLHDKLLKLLRRIRVAPQQRRSDTLEDYITPARAEEFKISSTEVLDQLQRSLLPLARQRGAAGEAALEMMWSKATPNANDSIRKLIRHQDNRLSVASDDQVRHALGMPRLGKIPARSGLVINDRTGNTFGLLLNHAGIRWSTRNNATDEHDAYGEPGNIFRAIYRMTLDVLVDSYAEHRTVLKPWWTVAGGYVSAGDLAIPWPAVDWPSFIDWELLLEAWNTRIIEQVSELSHVAAASGNSIGGYGDAAANWFIRASMHLARHRCRLDDIQFEFYPPRSERWSNIVRDFAHEMKQAWGKEHDMYQQACAEWFWGIGLFAAPESGLTVEAARGILDGIPDLDECRDHLIRLRMDRLKLRFGEENVSGWLEAISQRHPSHPWFERVERSSASSTPAP